MREINKEGEKKGRTERKRKEREGKTERERESSNAESIFFVPSTPIVYFKD
jgi:hypothetical protein